MARIRINRQYSINEVQTILNNNPYEVTILELINTKGLNLATVDTLKRLNGANRLCIRIIGGYDDKRVADYPDYVSMHRDDNVYSLDEMRKIYQEIDKIERGINSNWDDLQKLIYFIGYLKNKIVYHPFHENAPSREIRSLRGLFSKKTVCAGFALMLKELCDRNGIKCQYVEGTCNIEDYNRGFLTHAWNIVEINGHLVPVDLTWNAGDNNRGKMLDSGDLFNVNEFVKSHIPGRREIVQDYRRQLKSIDGVKVGVLDAFINKDIRFENNSFSGRRRNGSWYEINLVGQFIENNRVVYRYYYQGYSPDGRKGRPLILYSECNISEIVGYINKMDKIQRQISDAKRRNNWTLVRELERKLDLANNQYLYDANKIIDELLLSVENIRAAVDRRDYFIGGIKYGTSVRGSKYVDGVRVDTDLGTKIGLSQKYCTRSDGSSFIIEDFGKFKISNNQEVYRYRIYESVIENGKKVIIKNTVFADQDLFTDNRQGLYDDFLARARLDRKNTESNGYLGYYSREGIRTYSTPVRKYFNELCRRLVITDRDIRNYYNEITIPEMKRLVGTYEKVNIRGNDCYRNRTTGTIESNPDILLHIRFAYLWLFAAGVRYDQRDLPGLFGYTQAFNSSSAAAFTKLSTIITESMNTNGNIDPVQILIDVRREKNPEIELLVVRLFSSDEAVKTINQLFRLQNPSAKREQGDIEFFSKGRMSNAERLIARRRNLEAKKVILEVVKNSLGNVEVRRTR